MSNNYTQEQLDNAINENRERESKKRKVLALQIISRDIANKCRLPYRVVFDAYKKELIEGIESEDVPITPFYPAPAQTRATEKLAPLGIPKRDDLRELNGWKKQLHIYNESINREMENVSNAEKWAYYFGRFLIGYNFDEFSSMDFYGKKVESEEIEPFRKLCKEIQEDIKKNPNSYYLEKNPRKQIHKKMYCVSEEYI